MELQMLDLPLPTIEELKRYEKDYLLLNLQAMFKVSDLECKLEKDKHNVRKEKQNQLHQGNICLSFRYELAIYNFNNMVNRFKPLLDNKWDWDAYFLNLNINDFYVRWFFTI